MESWPEGKLRIMAGAASYNAEFREGAVRIVQETGKSAAQVARDLGLHEDTRCRTGSLPPGRRPRPELARLRLREKEQPRGLVTLSGA
ncbi:transposase [Streptacidiphilus rugosus]|uniref:transposase n=1 Tax=Streptacidiphilus rugosus TaxID=405783 RepID=UPI002FBDE169